MINNIIKLVLISFLALGFTACEDNNQTSKKEVTYKSSLPVPSSSQEIRDTKLNMVGLWYDAKKDPISATKIGYAYSEELKDYKKAIQWYKYSDSMKPMPENSNYACYAYQQLKKYDEAIKWCTNAIELGSDEALFRIGKVLELQAKYKEAITYYIKSFEKTKDEMSANNIGYIYKNYLKEYNLAKEWFEKSIVLGNHASYRNLSNLYFDNLNDNIKASAYAIALINTKYRKSSVLKVLRNDMKLDNETIKQGYEYQLNSKEIPIKYTGKLELE